VALSPLFPDELILGLEIRGTVVQLDQVSSAAAHTPA
jgi:hypothetical protein